MKIRCNRETFVEAISVVSRAVSTRATLPSLEGILLKAQDNAIELFGYDLDTGIVTNVEAHVDREGEIVLPARVLLEIVRKLPEEQMEFSVGDKFLTEIKSGFAQFTILGIDPADFPEFPSMGDTAAVSIAQNTLRSMIDQTLFAVAQSAQADAKPVHTGTLFVLSEENNSVTLVSVDGYRLALRRETCKIEESMRFIVPGRALSEMLRILPENDEKTKILVSKRHILFHVGPYEIFSRLLEGEFLDYMAAIPKKSDIRVRVSTREFIASIERAGLLISDRIKSPIRLQFSQDAIVLSCSTALGRVTDKIPAKTNGGPLEMGFNNRYLLDALRAAGCDEVTLEISGPLSPMKVVPLSGDGFLFLVLPVRLKNEQ
jgi:DNA polymerase-3 subunit beta